jgi:ABC-type multidrug transport system permease subunit
LKDPDLEPQFSWPLALFITGVCFVAFFCILVRLNQNGPRVFLWIGVTSLTIALLVAVISIFVKGKQHSQADNLDQ